MKDKREFVTREGRKLRLRPVSQLFLSSMRTRMEKEWRERGEPLDPPVYTVTTVAGDAETFPLTAETAAKGTPEEQATWEAHRSAVARFEQAHETAFLKVMLELGVEPDEGYNDPNWAKRAQKWGADVPEDEDERRAFYLATVALVDPDDIAEVLMQLTLISQAPGIDGAAVESALKIFRRPLRERARDAIDRLAAANEPVVAQPDVDSLDGDEGVEPDTEPVA